MIFPASELLAAQLEADQANAEMMREWLEGGHPYDSDWVVALRYYRECAEAIVHRLITEQVFAISPTVETVGEPEHIDYPHWSGTLLGCEACEIEMARIARKVP